ncbi:hypothetical protein BGX24_012819 [Mortierella sp. AD032]|nr:hypothetical protein BGX24_012819 [Mortierella sp. AD032]
MDAQLAPINLPPTFKNLPIELQDVIISHLGQQTLAGEHWRIVKAHGHLIQTLILKSNDMWLLHLFLKYSPTNFSSLTTIEVRAPLECYKDEEFARFLDLSSAGWKRLCFLQTGEFDSIIDIKSQFAKALLKHTGTLEVVRMHCKTEMDWRAVDELLCMAPLLKQVFFYGDYQSRRGGWMEAATIVGSSWICDNLQIFGYQIGGIPRADITRNIRNRPVSDSVTPGALQKSIALQRQIYAKLARLTKLRQLTLGFPPAETQLTYALEFPPGTTRDWSLGILDKDTHGQFNCLAMTVESGLDLLKGLTELRTVDLRYMDVDVHREKEQRWFKENWPLAKILTTD